MPDVLLILVALTVVLDQSSKNVVAKRLAFWPRHGVTRMPRLQVCKNPEGICLGLVKDLRVLLILWFLAVSGTFAAAFYLPALQGWLAQAGLGAAIGGASSNLLDRIRHGAVVDFIDLRVWPVFNLADAAILLGSGLALCTVMTRQW